MLHVNKGFDR